MSRCKQERSPPSTQNLPWGSDFNSSKSQKPHVASGNPSRPIYDVTPTPVHPLQTGLLALLKSSTVSDSGFHPPPQFLRSHRSHSCLSNVFSPEVFSIHSTILSTILPCFFFFAESSTTMTVFILFVCLPKQNESLCGRVFDCSGLQSQSLECFLDHNVDLIIVE